MRARGDGFFAAAETMPYQPRGILLGQETEDSCVAACCRMLLLDDLIDAQDNYVFSESFLRTALDTSEDGATISLIPAVLREFGAVKSYAYHKNLTLEDLQASIKLSPVIALIIAAAADEFHALIVEEIADDFIAVRDPLPVGVGSAYWVRLSLFLKHWLDQEAQCGLAVVELQ